MKIGAGLATSPDPRRAGREAARAASARSGPSPSLAVVFASDHFRDDATTVLAGVRDVVAPASLVGCVADAVVAGRREVEDEPSVAVWLAALPRPAETFHMEFLRTSAAGVYAGYLFDPSPSDLHVLLADPYTFPVEPLLEHLNAHQPGVTVMGGLVSGGAFSGHSRLFLDDQVLESGAVGVRLPGWRGVRVVSQGCRPIGDPYTVTAGRDRTVSGLGGRPPLHRLREMIASLPPEQQDLVSHGLLVGLLADEHVVDPARGDFLVRAITGADETSGAIEVGDEVEVGSTLQFQVRDAPAADEDLRVALQRARSAATGRPAGALLFTCNGRGRDMFGSPDHDARLIDELLGGVPLVGFFAAGELGPVRGRNALHGFTASLALFVDEDVGAC